MTAAALFLALAAGWWGRGFVSNEDDTSGTSSVESPCRNGAAPLYWKAPMDPTFVRDAPGKSPMGMDLIPQCPNRNNDAPDGAVVIDSATVQNMGVRTTVVERRDLARSVRAVGRVAYDERRMSLPNSSPPRKNSFWPHATAMRPARVRLTKCVAGEKRSSRHRSGDSPIGTSPNATSSGFFEPATSSEHSRSTRPKPGS